MKKFFSLLLALLMLAVMLPVTAMADENNYVMVSGIAGFENVKYDSFAAAYEAIKPTVETLGLGQESAANDAFDALFTNQDANGNATLTYTITGNVTYDETSCENLLTMGRKTSHYSIERHLINFKFVGATGRDSDTLTVNSGITLPYEWWGEKKTTSISFEGLTITGSASSGLFPYQSFFEGIDFKVNNCKLVGMKIHNYSNVGGSYTFTNSIFDGAGANAYAIHLQGHQTEPLNITISGNTIFGYARGINIDQKTAVAKISNNVIRDLNGVTSADGSKYGSAVQLTQGKSFLVEDNTINTENVNAFHFHSAMNVDSVESVVIRNNNVKAPYLLWNEAGLEQGKITSSGNILDIANPGKALAKVKENDVDVIKELDSPTTIEGTTAPGTITIIVPSTEEPKPADDQKNPATGANDFVGVAAAAAVIALLGSAVVLRKK